MRFIGTLAVAALILGTMALQGPVHAQGGGVCFVCGGTPAEPVCVGGRPSGFAVCTTSANSCTVSIECGSGHGCFVAGTPVQTPGGEIAIEDLMEGDEVIGQAADGGLAVNKVVQTYRALAVKYFVINGDLAVTGTHPFLVGSDWVEAQDLRVGDALVNSDGAEVLIMSLEPVEFGVRAFNITVSGNHTFFADGILVHNKGPDPNN